MPRRLPILAALLAAAVIVPMTIALASLTAAQEPEEKPEEKPEALSLFMRAKLDHSKDVLEGLSVGDFEKIAEGASALGQLSEHALWRVSPNITYVRFTEEFQRLSSTLEEQANDQNLDGATLSFVNLTINCVDCHKFIRSPQITRADGPTRLR